MKPPPEPSAVRVKCWPRDGGTSRLFVVADCCVELRPRWRLRSIYLFLPFSFQTNKHIPTGWTGKSRGQETPVHSHDSHILFLPLSLSFIISKFLSAAFWTHTHTHTVLWFSGVCGCAFSSQTKGFCQTYISVRDLMPISNTVGPSPPLPTHTRESLDSN